MDVSIKEYITANIVNLIKTTDCNPELLAILQTDRILSAEDVDQLDCQPEKIKRAKQLYNILQTKREFIESLISALEQTSQVIPLGILQMKPKFRNYGLISIDKNRLLGKGNQDTEVYRGTFNDMDVAVKVIKSNVGYARKEVDALQKLDRHKNVVRYYFSEIHQNKIYIAFELCLHNLQDEITLKLLSIDTVKIVSGCIKGVRFLHQEGIIHRDFKPTNILVNKYKRIKITDFGFSKQLNPGMSVASMSGNYGTFDWMAPEIINFIEMPDITKKFGKKTDIFSLGCVIFFVLANGEHPFGTGNHIPHNIANNKSIVYTSELDNDVKRLISKLINQNPKKRPSANDVLSSSALKRLLTNYKEKKQQASCKTKCFHSKLCNWHL